MRIYLLPPQVPGQLHGGRPWRLHEGESPPGDADHRSSQEVHGAHKDHLPTGQEAAAGPAPHGGGRGAG